MRKGIRRDYGPRGCFGGDAVMLAFSAVVTVWAVGSLLVAAFCS